jgi:hypothetical protein
MTGHKWMSRRTYRVMAKIEFKFLPWLSMTLDFEIGPRISGLEVMVPTDQVNPDS